MISSEAKIRLTNLYDVLPSELDAVLGELVSPPFRVRQIREWLYSKGVDSFEEMTNLPKQVREELAERFVLGGIEVRSRTEPAEDGSRKYLLALRDNALIEAVYMPMRDRISICLSSQAGCAVGCTFCVTGFFGAGRNLLPSEMIGQVNLITRENQVPNEKMNLVFMGMGEPLLNFDSLVATLEILYTRISPRRITISTSGITPVIDELANLQHRPNLAISINAPDQKRREEIMPITKKYPLGELMDALRRFPLEKGRELTAEYVLLAGYNDSTADAAALSKLLRGLHVKANVIPFNPDANLPSWMKRPTDPAIDRFVRTLVDHGTAVTVRRSKGRDISAACGQLRGKTERRKR